MSQPLTGTIFDIDTFAIHDGPGIRMSVYFKGCPLRCRWCHSPESVHAKPELIYVANHCTRCGACARVCPSGVHSVSEDVHTLQRSACRSCFACVEACPTTALQIKGRSATVDEIVTRAVRMKPFFDNSGGGITLTGGEVTMQSEFAAAILKRCRDEGIRTAIETCGLCSEAVLARVRAHADLVLFDMKLADDDEHKRWTGSSNAQILANASKLDPDRTIVRVPLIPGITDTESNVRGIYARMREAGLTAVELLPYNPSSPAKYEWLGLQYEIDGEPQDDEYLDKLARMSAEFGVTPLPHR